MDGVCLCSTPMAFTGPRRHPALFGGGRRARVLNADGVHGAEEASTLEGTTRPVFMCSTPMAFMAPRRRVSANLQAGYKCSTPMAFTGPRSLDVYPHDKRVDLLRAQRR